MIIFQKIFHGYRCKTTHKTQPFLEGGHYHGCFETPKENTRDTIYFKPKDPDTDGSVKCTSIQECGLVTNQTFLDPPTLSHELFHLCSKPTEEVKKRHQNFNIWWSDGNTTEDPKSYAIWEEKEPSEERDSKEGTPKGASKINKSVLQPHFANMAQSMKQLYHALKKENMKRAFTSLNDVRNSFLEAAGHVDFVSSATNYETTTPDETQEENNGSDSDPDYRSSSSENSEHDESDLPSESDNDDHENENEDETENEQEHQPRNKIVTRKGLLLSIGAIQRRLSDLSQMDGCDLEISTDPPNIRTVRSLLGKNFYKNNEDKLDLGRTFIYLKTRHLKPICKKWNDDTVDTDNDETPQWIALLIQLMKTQCDESTQQAWSWSVKDANNNRKRRSILIYKMAVFDQGYEKDE